MCAERHRYEVDVDLNSPSAQATVVRMTGTDKRVLEIGAGPGAISRVLQQQGCHVVALEKDPSALPLLSRYCDRMIQADLDDPSWPSSLQGAGPFEAVVIADVLEHLYDPAATLRNVKPLLAREGCVIASLPHASHASVHACLFREDFRYGDWGLLDSTHIRYFGLKNMQALFEKAGYEIIDAMLIILTPEEDVQFASLWNGLPSKLKAAIRLNEFSNVYQVVIKARPSGTPDRGLQLMSLSVTSPVNTVILGKPGRLETEKFRFKRALMKTLGEKNGKKAWDKLSRMKRHLVRWSHGV